LPKNRLVAGDQPAIMRKCALFLSKAKFRERPAVAASHYPTMTCVLFSAGFRCFCLHGPSSGNCCKLLGQKGFYTSRWVCALMRKPGLFAHQPHIKAPLLHIGRPPIAALRRLAAGRPRQAPLPRHRTPSNFPVLLIQTPL